MSLEKEQLIKCPGCGNEGNFVVWRSLNTSLNPQAKEELIAGRLFKYECPHCKEIHNIDYDMLYHDMEHQIMIQFAPTEDTAKEAKENFDNMKDGKLPVHTEDETGYTLRIVKDQNHLREKVYIFDQGLDDKVIELMKAVMISQLINQDHEISIKDVFLDISEDGPKNFAILLTDGTWGNTEFTKEIYEAVRDNMLVQIEEDEKEYYIDIDWAISKLTNNN